MAHRLTVVYEWVRVGAKGGSDTLDNNSTRIFREKIRGGITMLRSKGIPRLHYERESIR
jgi:hypothetical protein